MKQLLSIITIFFLFSCGGDHNELIDSELSDSDTTTCHNKIDSLNKESISDYDMSMVDKENSEEFMESLVKIEKEFGEQWSFCDCVVKGDSINKAFADPKLSDKEFDRLSARFDVIDEKCKAFRIQNPNVTPEERAEHERKVRKCLKEAGIK